MPNYPQLPLIGVRIRNTAGGDHYLNDRPSDGVGSGVGLADNITFSSIMNGGFEAAEFRIAGSEKTAYSGWYAYGAQVTLFISSASSFDTSNQPKHVVWDGFVKTPTPNQDGTWTIKCVGWYTLLESMNTPLLWREEDYDEWTEGGSEPFESAAYKPHDAVDISVKKGMIRFSIPKGSDVMAANDPDATLTGAKKVTGARVLWSYPGVKIYRVEFTLENDKIPGGSTTPAYDLKLQRGDSDGVAATDLVNVASYQADLVTKGDNSKSTLLDTPRGLVGFYFFRSRDSEDATQQPFAVRIKRPAINGDAYRNANAYAVGNANWGAYESSQVVKDLADKLGVDTPAALVPDSGDNALPLFWTEGSWFDLMEELAQDTGNKWGMWENGQFEFRGWSASNTTWKVKAFGAGAHAIAELAPSDDQYHKVVVTYRNKKNGKRRAYEVDTGVTYPKGKPNRMRVYRHHIKRPLKVPSGGGHPAKVIDVAAKLAARFSAEVYSGTVRLSYALDSTRNDTPFSAVKIRAGQKLHITDWTGLGTGIFEIQGAEADDDGVTLTIGMAPGSISKYFRKIRLIMGYVEI
jgi:hypothetical protein